LAAGVAERITLSQAAAHQEAAGQITVRDKTELRGQLVKVTLAVKALRMRLAQLNPLVVVVALLRLARQG
jgi:hypothetical protein